MRFSIRVLLLIVFLTAIIFAALLSERPGKRYTRVAAVDFSPAGDQLAVSVLGCNGFTEKEPIVFDRTISIVEFPSLKSKYVVRRDRQQGGNQQNFTFWHFQADVVHTQSHLLFLNRSLSSLMIKNLETGDLKEWARFLDGEIHSFDASADASLIVLQGKSPFWPEGEEIVIDGETYIVPIGKSAMEMIKKEDSMDPIGIVSNLGIEEKDIITIPLPDDDMETNGTESESNEEAWRALRPRALPYLIRPDLTWRSGQQVLIVPRDESSRIDAAGIGIANGAFSLELSAETLQAVGELNGEPPPHRWKNSMYDFAASRGACRFAKLLENDQILLNISTDRFDFTDNVNLRLRWNTDPGSVIALSKTGKLVAGSENQRIRLLDTSNLISSHEEIIAWQMRQMGKSDIFEEAKIVEHNTVVTAMAISPDEEYLVTGDDNGYLSAYEIASGELVTRCRAMRKTRGLPFYVVILMFAVWVWFSGSMFISWLNSRQQSEET